jgi:hypothetical protein
VKQVGFGIVLAILAFGTVGAVGAVPDPNDIYVHARFVWTSQQYPPYVSYTIAIDVNEGGVAKSNHYQATYDARHNRVHVEAVSEEERVNPHVPTGMEMTLDPKNHLRTLFKKPVGHPDEAVDYLGVPLLAPNYSFGVARYVPEVASTDADRAALVQEVRRQFNDPMPASKMQDLQNGGDPKVIGRVVSSSRDYQITYRGIEPVDGRDAYHLSLRPLRSPGDLRLRDIWVDTQTFATVKLITQGNFTNSNVRWLITFTNVAGSRYIKSETALKPVGVGRHLYQNATITFENLAPASPPSYLFDSIAPLSNALTEPS